MDEKDIGQANLVGQSRAELSALERRVRRLTSGTSTLQGPLARIDWRHTASRDPVLSRIWVAEK